MGQYLPVDSEVGGLNLGDGKSLFFWTAKMKWKRSVQRRALRQGQKLDPYLQTHHISLVRREPIGLARNGISNYEEKGNLNSQPQVAPSSNIVVKILTCIERNEK